jgi:hypothetical protein
VAAKTTELNIKITGNPTGAVQSIEQVERRTDTFAQRIRAKMREDRAEGIGAVERFFRPQQLAQEGLEKLLGGGPAGGVRAAGVTAALNAIAAGSEKARESYSRLAKGEVSVAQAHAEFASGIAKSIPVLGEAVTAVENIAGAYKSYRAAVILAQSGDRSRAFAELPAGLKREAINEALSRMQQLAKVDEDIMRNRMTLGKAGLDLEQARANVEKYNREIEIGDLKERLRKMKSDATVPPVEVGYIEDLIARKRADNARLNADSDRQMGLHRAERARQDEDQITQIQAEARAERLKDLNRNLDAQEVEVWESYRQQIDSLEKRYREEHGVREANLKDPTLAASEKAALDRLGSQLGEIEQKREQEYRKKLSEGIFGIGDNDAIEHALREEFMNRRFSGGFVDAVESHSMTGAGAARAEEAERMQKTLEEISEKLGDVKDAIEQSNDYTGGGGWEGN